jgi:hypothetical protein
MNKLGNKKAFQDFFKNAPEMPQSQISTENPRSNGNVGLIVFLAVVVVGQFLTLMALDKLINGSGQKITYIPLKPMDEEVTLPTTETETPPTEVKS